MSKTPEPNAVVTQKDELTPRLMILRIAAAGWPLPHFEAGQYVVLGLPPDARRCRLSQKELIPPDRDKLIRRAYSIASSSLSGEYLDFYISLVSDGALTPRLFNLGVGDKLWLSSHPVGLFTLGQVPAERHIILVATGTGLAPYMSMLTSHLECGGSRRFAVLHGARHSWDLGYRAELETLQHLCVNFNYEPTIDCPEDEPVPWHGHIGRVQEIWQAGTLASRWGFSPSPDNSDIFLCGVPGMIDVMLEQLTREGHVEHHHGNAGNVHVERY
ncbi:MAG: ferredoxin--NADP reductase [Planctomycetales bacterium]|nr:ferredoxin--NADP reductase [Planctomycetales bacterium]